jgi:hypothetical protein
LRDVEDLSGLSQAAAFNSCNKALELTQIHCGG